MPINSENFAKYLKNLATMRDYPFIADSFLDFHLKKCADCQYDRMICAISPMCFRRYFLTILMKNGVVFGDKELPAFCYSQHLSNIQRYLAGKRTLYPPFDSIVFMKDFFELVFPKSKKKLIRLLERDDLEKLKDELVDQVEKEKIIISMGDDFAVLIPPGDVLGPEYNLFFLDFDRRYVIIDPRKEEIFFKNELKVLLVAFSEAYGIHVKSLGSSPEDGGGSENESEDDDSSWYVDFSIGQLHEESQIEPLNIQFMEIIDDFVLSASEVRLLIEEQEPREAHVLINLSMERGKFSIEKERIDFDKVKKLFSACQKLQNFLSPKEDNKEGK